MDRQTDEWTELQWLRRTTAVAAIARNDRSGGIQSRQAIKQ